MAAKAAILKIYFEPTKRPVNSKHGNKYRGDVDKN